jgi:glycosyltransferase involved in cell wall biosynthesis
VTKIALFDWTAGGHRPTYVRRMVDALQPSSQVVLALPQETLDAVGDMRVETFSLGEARPPLAGRLSRRSVLAEEAARFREAAGRADQALHLYADHVLVRLVMERRFPSPTSLLLYYPRAHYRAAFGTRLSRGDRAVAQAKEWAVRSWRRRPDAQAVFTLDEEAARGWGLGGGAGAHWLPEPPVRPLAPEERPEDRVGCVLYGALAARKGIDLVARALTLEQTPVRLVLAGSAEAPYMSELREYAAAMASSGVEVDLRPHHHSELEGLRVLAGASCALLPYPRHSGMSRVLLEACSVGTPVVAHRFGLLGHLVSAYGLGLSVDCENPVGLRRAVMTLADPARSAEYAESLETFAARFAPDRFRAALVSGLRLDAGVSAEHRR